MKSSKKPHKSPKQQVALCYIRQSYTRDEEDTNSPDRQRANIERIVERNNWIPKWFEDVGGHKSGRYEDNRPGWLALKERLNDPDIAAVVANDLSRLHRNVSSISNLIEILEEQGVALILAASDISIDTSTLMGQMFAQFSGLMDAYYAKDISAKAKDSIMHRKRQGKTVGIPPFGTERDEDGYLKPLTTGAWLMPDGTFIAGTHPDKPPDENALWRGYYDCACYILEIYAEGDLGLEKIAYRLNTEGWVFRNRRNNPRPINRSDVLRVISNWQEYGGIVTVNRGKDRPAYAEYDLDAIPFVEKRAVMPIKLLQKVAQVRKKRTIRPKDHGVKREAYAYPLSVITRCNHCEQLAEIHNNPKLRSTLSGRTDANNIRRYKHKTGVKCGCTNRSVPCEIYEEDFIRLVRMATINPDMINAITELAIQADKVRGVYNPDDLEENKQKAIALYKRRINAAIILFDEGQIDYEGYRKRIEKYEREMALWQSRTTETEKVAFELALCADAINEMHLLWDTAEPETKQRLARNLFEYLVYDLDTRQIVAYKFKPTIDRFVRLRAALQDDVVEVIGKEKFPDLQDQGNDIPPRGLATIPCCEAINSSSPVVSAAVT